MASDFDPDLLDEAIELEKLESGLRISSSGRDVLIASRTTLLALVRRLIPALAAHQRPRGPDYYELECPCTVCGQTMLVTSDAPVSHSCLSRPPIEQV